MFLLKAFYDALCEIANTEQVIEQVTEQVERLLEVIGDEEYLTKERMELLGMTKDGGGLCKKCNHKVILSGMYYNHK